MGAGGTFVRYAIAPVVSCLKGDALLEWCIIGIPGLEAGAIIHSPVHHFPILPDISPQILPTSMQFRTSVGS